MYVIFLMLPEWALVAMGQTSRRYRNLVRMFMRRFTFKEFRILGQSLAHGKNAYCRGKVSLNLFNSLYHNGDIMSTNYMFQRYHQQCVGNRNDIGVYFNFLLQSSVDSRILHGQGASTLVLFITHRLRFNDCLDMVLYVLKKFSKFYHEETFQNIAKHALYKKHTAMLTHLAQSQPNLVRTTAENHLRHIEPLIGYTMWIDGRGVLNKYAGMASWTRNFLSDIQD